MSSPYSPGSFPKNRQISRILGRYRRRRYRFRGFHAVSGRTGCRSRPRDGEPMVRAGRQRHHTQRRRRDRTGPDVRDGFCARGLNRRAAAHALGRDQDRRSLLPRHCARPARLGGWHHYPGNGARHGGGDDGEQRDSGRLVQSGLVPDRNSYYVDSLFSSDRAAAANAPARSRPTVRHPAYSHAH